MPMEDQNKTCKTIASRPALCGFEQNVTNSYMYTSVRIHGNVAICQISYAKKGMLSVNTQKLM